MHTARKLHRFLATKNIIYNNEMVHLANRVSKLNQAVFLLGEYTSTQSNVCG